MSGKISSTIRKHPLATFIVLSYAFSWWMWPLYLWDLSPAVIAGFGPFLAAVAVLGVTGGRSALKDLARQMVRWRIGWRWYVVALGLPLVITGLAAAINILLGAPIPDERQVALWPMLVTSFLMLLLIPGIGGAWEEPGWRGYALPQLENGRSRLADTFPLSLVIAGWHLPLFLTGIIPWADLLYLLGTVVIFNWVYYRAERSVLIIMIFHAMNNAVGQYFPALFSDAYHPRLALLQGIVCLAIALLVVMADNKFWADRPEVKLMEVEPAASR